jgi:hypothetical protein
MFIYVSLGSAVKNRLYLKAELSLCQSLGSFEVQV